MSLYCIVYMTGMVFFKGVAFGQSKLSIIISISQYIIMINLTGKTDRDMGQVW